MHTPVVHAVMMHAMMMHTMVHTMRMVVMHHVMVKIMMMHHMLMVKIVMMHSMMHAMMMMIHISDTDTNTHVRTSIAWHVALCYGPVLLLCRRCQIIGANNCQKRHGPRTGTCFNVKLTIRSTKGKLIPT